MEMQKHLMKNCIESQNGTESFIHVSGICQDKIREQKPRGIGVAMRVKLHQQKEPARVKERIS